MEVRVKFETDKLMYEIIRADERHRKDINRLTRKISAQASRNAPIKNMWVVRDNNKNIVACCGLDFHNNNAILTSLAVDEKFRHQGIGSSLISHRLKIAAELNVTYVALVTMYYHFNFYKRRGFQTCPRTDLPLELRDYWMFTVRRYKKCAVMYRKL